MESVDSDKDQVANELSKPHYLAFGDQLRYSYFVVFREFHGLVDCFDHLFVDKDLFIDRNVHSVE